MKIGSQNQRGITFIGFLLVCSLLVFFAYIGMRLWPIYNEKIKVDNALDSLSQRSDIAQMNTASIGKNLLRFFEVEDVDQFSTLSDMKGIFSVTRVKGKNERMMGMTYEIRRPLIADFDIVLKYDKSLIIPGTGG